MKNDISTFLSHSPITVWTLTDSFVLNIITLDL